jgi:hypothetical protein
MPTYWKGKTFSAEHRRRLSESHLGAKNPMFGKFNELNPNWKGDAAKMNAIHEWVERHLGKPRVCSHCNSTTSKRYDWANLSGKYKRDLKDWIRLCRSCHRKFDKAAKKMWLTKKGIEWKTKIGIEWGII